MAATVSYAGNVATLTPTVSAGQRHDLHGNITTGVDVFGRKRAGVELLLDIYHCRSSSADRDLGDASEPDQRASRSPQPLRQLSARP